ncbi:DUF1003 domain-containing protein [Cellulomonas alba]|uniref:DUF1003 domain-containing protein n=1 Tax=Cellulomonas alba TaxID=3053467 RepID=A0ABT7SDE4_9CELL|nr:DUF1003 domain-containing protein [Cellulomonas alba]MDM7854202.1 DUF1003 domain-containing protein [Cellulomonas alba]
MPDRRLDTPRTARRSWRPAVDQDAVGRGAEAFARFMGTGKFLLYMSAFVVVWVLINAFALFGLHWDPYPFILLNLFFSVQASYAAPLILLAQNRQDDRDRVALEQDRQQAERNLADTEFLAREMASLRIAVSEVATRDFVRSELRNLLEDLTELTEELAEDDDERDADDALATGDADDPARRAAEREAAEAKARKRAAREADRKREARAEQERKREARAEQERKREARAEHDRKREARAEQERKREARAEQDRARS